MKKILLSTLIVVFVLAPALIFADEPGFNGELNYPSGYIAPYPEIERKVVISLFDNNPYFTNPFRQLRHVSALERSSFDNKSLTFTRTYYNRGKYKYSYTSRTADAESFYQYREKALLKQQLGQFRATALSKRQQDKAGGLLSLNIPIKSKTFEELFGEGGAGLKVSGYHRISFSGRSQWTDGPSTATNKQSKFPALNMEQISRFDINGTIGSKITVSVSQDSKSDVPLANRLILRYKGDEDDVLQSIEAGNTNLSLPNTRFVGYSQRIRGLFGLKATAQVGGFSLTAIASQEKGNSERTSFEPGAGATMKNIRDFQYAYGRIFDLGRMSSNYDDPSKYDFHQGDSIISIEVYKYGKAASGNIADPAAPKGYFYVDLDDTANYDSENGNTNVHQVDPSEYSIHATEHWILFNYANGGSETLLGYFMIVKRNGGKIDTIGSVTEVPYRLKLIRNNQATENFVTWGYEWRNVYSLGASNIDLEGLEINVFKGGNGNENLAENEDNQRGIKYTRILGLDRFDRNGNPTPDNLVDVNSTIIDPYRGLLIFPDRKPFATDRSFSNSDTLSLMIPEIYTLSYGHAELTQKSTYYLQVSNLSRQAEISLNKPNIIENSERITVNGVELTKGKHYNINYDFGRVTFTDYPDALDANADISIDFEYTPFITSQKKSLFGVRGEYEFNENLKLGTTFLYKSDKATERKPKVGQETSRAFVWDADISFKVTPGFLTGMVNALPFYKTDAKSTLQISAEVAQSFPNPNVDGAAYIDDFEGSRDSYSMGIFRDSWTRASRPNGLENDYYRSRMIWYNPYTQIATNTIWDRELRPGETGTHTLWVEFAPHDSDIVFVNPETLETDSTVIPKSWTGIMRSLSTGVVNQDRAQLLEFRIYGNQGIMHVELGSISEDLNNNGVLDTEDKEDPYSLIPNGIIDQGEDIGLDGLIDNEEPGFDEYANPDPAGDNWWYNGSGIRCSDCVEDPYDYRFINGTEGNTDDPGRLGRPDTEDLDREGDLDKLNSYFSFEVNLADSRFLVDSSEFNGWRTFRIPVRDPDALDLVHSSSLDDADWARIQYIRLWFESPNEDSLQIGIAAADIIQSNWDDTLAILSENLVLTDLSKFSVAVINNQENTEYKNDPPPGVSGFYDKTNDIVEPEQSLLLHYENLNPGDTCIAKRFFYDTPNYVGYRKLNMLVHGAPGTDSIMFFFRLGDAEDKYYEYRTILKPGWHADNEVNIDFNEITALKEYLLQAKVDNPDTNEIIDGNYRVWGNPTITRVKYLACGLVNISKKNAAYFHPTGDIWVNELKLIDVRKDVGTAARVAVSGNMADLFTYRGNYEYQNSYFQKLSSSSGSGANLGSGKTSTSYSAGVSLNLNKLIPRSFGTNIPVSISYSKKEIIPRLKTNSDIVLPPEFQDDESTISESKGFSISESFSKKTKNPLFTMILNPFKSNFSYNRVEGRSPQRPSSFTETYHMNGSYAFRIARVPGIKPFFWTSPIPVLKKLSGSKFYFFPKSISATGNFDRNLSISENSSGVVAETLKRTFGGNARLDYDVSNNLKTNYSMNTKRDLNDPDKVKITLNPKTFRLGRETSYGQSFGATYQFSLFSFLTHNFIYSVDYRETMDVRDSTRHASSTKSYGVNGSLDHQKLFSLGIVEEDQRRANRRNRGRRSTKEIDSTEVKPKKSLKKRVLGPASKVLTFLTSWLNPIGYDFNERYSYSYNGLTERAQLAFRFGFTDGVGVPIKSTTSGTTRSTAISKLTSYSFRTGTQFFGGLKTDISFARKITRDIVKATNRNKTISTTFPDIKFTIGELRTFKFLNAIIRKFRPRTGFTKSVDKTYDLQTGYQTSEKTSTSQRPLLSLTASVLGGVQLTFMTDRSVSESRSLNSQSGEVTSKNRTTLSNTSFSIKYSFNSPRGIKLPFFGRLKFRSNLSLSTDVSFRRQMKESAAKGGGYSTTGDETNFVVTPSMSYSFSSQINGGLAGKWSTTNNVAQKRKSNVRELRIWVEIRF